MTPLLAIENVSKAFELHQQGHLRLPVFERFSAAIEPGETIAVTGPSGRGKSSLLKLIYGTYKASSGSIRVRHDAGWTDVVTAAPREILALRRQTVAFVTQFLRVIPRVPAETVVAEPLIERGVAPDRAIERARQLLERLCIPRHLWHLSPMTFSGGEQQRVNIARGFAAAFPLILLDEPTASLDLENRNRVLQLIGEARAQGSAIVAVFHDDDERRRACSREIAIG